MDRKRQDRQDKTGKCKLWYAFFSQDKSKYSF